MCGLVVLVWFGDWITKSISPVTLFLCAYTDYYVCSSWMWPLHTIKRRGEQKQCEADALCFTDLKNAIEVTCTLK